MLSEAFLVTVPTYPLQSPSLQQQLETQYLVHLTHCKQGQSPREEGESSVRPPYVSGLSPSGFCPSSPDDSGPDTTSARCVSTK